MKLLERTGFTVLGAGIMCWGWALWYHSKNGIAAAIVIWIGAIVLLAYPFDEPPSKSGERSGK